MSLGLKRSDLQSLSEAKMEDALLLASNRRFSNAFYLAGYAIELGLKACISKQIQQGVIPDKNFINELYRHDFKNLIGLAGLTQQLEDEQNRNRAFATYWASAGQWDPSSRYKSTDSYTAQLMLEAISDPNNGIMRWIRLHW